MSSNRLIQPVFFPLFFLPPCLPLSLPPNLKSQPISSCFTGVFQDICGRQVASALNENVFKEASMSKYEQVIQSKRKYQFGVSKEEIKIQLGLQTRFNCS